MNTQKHLRRPGILLLPAGKPWRLVLHSVFAVVAGAGLLPTARAQFVQQGSKLVGTGAVGYPEQGTSVAISADGNTAIIGGPGDGGPGENNVIGAAWVFTRSGGVWTQQGGKLVGTGAVGGAEQGQSVALSADGNTAIVGGPRDNNEAGAAWVYTRSGGVWAQQGGKLVGAGAAGDLFSNAVALSADGNTAIIGAPGHNNNAGAAWVFTRSGGVWSQQGSTLVGSGAVGSAYQGGSVALSADGNTAMVGGRWDNNDAGAVWFYTRSGGVWSQQGTKLVGTGAVQGTLYILNGINGAEQGSSVALSADGNTAMVGGVFDNDGAGAVWFYTRSGGVWSQQGPKSYVVGPNTIGNGFGVSVALSGDGNTGAIGEFGVNNSAGAATVCSPCSPSAILSQSSFDAYLVGTGAVGQAMQGQSVAISADGSTAMVGGPIDNNEAGAVWAFVSSVTPPPPPTLPAPFIDGVVNDASYLPGIAPGTWITIWGTNLSTTTGSSDFSGSNLPTQLDGVSVTVDGKAAYVYFISPTQLNVLSPDDATQRAVPVQVTTAQGMSNIVDATETALSPALFTFSQQGGMYAAAVRANGTYIGPPNFIPGVTTVPASPGDILLLFGTGFGPTTPPSPIGQSVTPAPLANQVTVQIGGEAANTQFAGIVTPGLYQFNVVVPNVPNGYNTVSIQIGGVATQPNVFLTVQRSLATAQSFAYVANFNSNNVSAYTINPATGALIGVAGSPFTAGWDPAWMTVDPTGKFVYVANAADDNVWAYTTNSGTGALTAVAGSPFSAGLAPRGVTVDPTGKFAYVANYSSNNVSAYTINSATGALTAIPGSPFAGGSAPISVTVDPTGKFAYVANYISSNNVSAYTINSATGALTAVPGSPFAAGTQPDFVAVDPTGRFAYVANEFSNNVSAYTISSATGALTSVPGSPFSAGTYPLPVTVDPTGKFVYVVNAGDNNVSAYTINPATGALTAVAGSPFAAGSAPRSVTVDPTGEFAYVANEDSSNVSAYTINPATGALTAVPGSPFAAGSHPYSVVTTTRPF